MLEEIQLLYNHFAKLSTIHSNLIYKLGKQKMKSLMNRNKKENKDKFLENNLK